MKKFRGVIGALLVGVLALALAACGSSSKSTGGSGSGSSASAAPKLPLKAGEDASQESLTGAKTGGTLSVLSSESFSHLDPGQA